MIHIECNAPVADPKSPLTDTRISQRLSENEWVIRVDEPLELSDDALSRRRIEGAELAASTRRE